MTDNLFEDTGSDLPTIDPNKNYLDELVGEGKKFKSHEDLARGKYEADQFIEIMKKRQDELRTDYLKEREQNDTRATLEELKDLISKQQHTSNELPPVNDDQPKYDPKEIETLVSSKIQDHENSKRFSENSTLVRDKLKERYGNNYLNVLKDQTESLGLTEDFVKDLARRHPNVLLKTLGLDQPQSTDPFHAPPRSNQRSDNFAPTGAKKRTWSYYQDLKKSNPKLYFDPKIAVQMQNDILAQGEAFKDGDYKVYGD